MIFLSPIVSSVPPNSVKLSDNISKKKKKVFKCIEIFSCVTYEAPSLNAVAILFCREIYSSARNKDRKRDKEETDASKRKRSRYSIVGSL